MLYRKKIIDDIDNRVILNCGGHRHETYKVVITNVSVIKGTRSEKSLKFAFKCSSIQFKFVGQSNSKLYLKLAQELRLAISRDVFNLGWWLVS